MKLSSVKYVLWHKPIILGYQLQYKEADGSSYRDSTYETPGTPKVSFSSTDRACQLETFLCLKTLRIFWLY